MGYLDIARQVKKDRIIEKNPHALIDRTIKDISRHWVPGTLEWMERDRPEEWRRMLVLEGEINKMASRGDLEGLRGALSNYQELILATVRELRVLKEGKEKRII